MYLLIFSISNHDDPVLLTPTDEATHDSAEIKVLETMGPILALALVLINHAQVVVWGPYRSLEEFQGEFTQCRSSVGST